MSETREQKISRQVATLRSGLVTSLAIVLLGMGLSTALDETIGRYAPWLVSYEPLRLAYLAVIVYCAR